MRFLSLLVAAVTLAACDAAAPHSVVGTYMLSSSGGEASIVDGRIDFNADGTFADALSYENKSTLIYHGTWVLQGSTVTFTVPGNLGGGYTASVSGTRLTRTDFISGAHLSYAKQE